ncbi:MAG: DUF3352 domain-containing protein [Saprospiraceae bacterium]
MSEINTKQVVQITSFISALLALTVIAAFIFRWQGTPFAEPDTFRAVPYNSAFVIDIKSSKSIKEALLSKPYFENVRALELVNEITEKWADIESFYKKIPNGKPQQVTIAAQIGANNQLDYVFILNKFEKRFRLAKIVKDLPFLSELVTFEKQPFYHFIINDTTQIHLAQSQKMLIAANSAVLVESVLSQLNNSKQSISKQKSLSTIRGLTGKSTDLSIYFNMAYVPIFASFFMDETPLKSLSFIKNYAEWIGLDISFKEKYINLNGYLYPSSDNQLLKSLKRQELPDKTLIASVLPDNTAAMTYIGYKNATDFFKDLQFTDNADFQQYFVPWLGEEVAYVITEPRMRSVSEHQFAFFKIKNQELAKEKLTKFGASFGALEGEQYFNYSIERMMARDVLKPVFGEGLNPIHNPFYVILDDYLVFANSVSALKELLDKYTYGQTLGQDVNYLQFVENLSSTSNMYFYINTTNVLNILTATFKKEFKNNLELQFEEFQKLTPIGIQLTPYQDLYFLNAQIRYNKKGKQATSVLWKADLNANAAIAPTFVKNHTNEELEVFVQDEANVIYLFNKNGEELWHRAIDGKIISDIHQIDFFKNTYLQYLFNTDEKIYLIDRNGGNVQDFPITMGATITNGLMVADYDTTRDYRYFVACDDENIYGFRNGGELLEGWSPKGGIGSIRFPLQHFQVAGKDYIVAQNEATEMFFFERNGSPRMDSVQFNTSTNSPFGYDLSEPQRIVFANSEGKAHILNFNKEYFRLGMNIGNNRGVQFLYSDILGDERKDYIVLDEQEIGVFSYTKDREFKRFAKRYFDTEQDTLFEVKLIGNDKIRLGTLSKSYRRAYLLNEKAKLFPDFPIPATTPFEVRDLYNDGKNVLIVANGNAIFAYKLKQLEF